MPKILVTCELANIKKEFNDYGEAFTYLREIKTRCEKNVEHFVLGTVFDLERALYYMEMLDNIDISIVATETNDK